MTTVFYYLLASLLLVSSAAAQSDLDTLWEDDFNNGSTTVTPIMTTPAVSPNDVYSVTDPLTGRVCLLIAFNATFHIPFVKTDGETDTANVEFNHHMAIPTGSCDNITEHLILAWKPSTAPLLSASWRLQMVFTPAGDSTPQPIDADQKKYKLSNLTLIYQLENATFPHTNFTDERQISVKNGDHLIAASVGETYTCNADRQATFADSDAKMNIRNLRVDAFRSSNTTTFSTKEWLCKEDVPLTYVVPIVVGVILTVLVLVGLLAYFIGRHRMQRSSYQAM